MTEILFQAYPGGVQSLWVSEWPPKVSEGHLQFSLCERHSSSYVRGNTVCRKLNVLMYVLMNVLMNVQFS